MGPTSPPNQHSTPQPPGRGANQPAKPTHTPRPPGRGANQPAKPTQHTTASRTWGQAARQTNTAHRSLPDVGPTSPPSPHSTPRPPGRGANQPAKPTQHTTASRLRSRCLPGRGARPGPPGCGHGACQAEVPGRGLPAAVTVPARPRCQAGASRLRSRCLPGRGARPGLPGCGHGACQAEVPGRGFPAAVTVPARPRCQAGASRLRSRCLPGRGARPGLPGCGHGACQAAISWPTAVGSSNGPRWLSSGWWRSTACGSTSAMPGANSAGEKS